MPDHINLATADRQNVIVQAPANGAMTATSKVAVALKAGSAEMKNRGRLTIRNISDYPVRLGGSDITTDKGLLLYPGEVHQVQFDRNIPVSYYAISTGFSAELDITEE